MRRNPPKQLPSLSMYKFPAYVPIYYIEGLPKYIRKILYPQIDQRRKVLRDGSVAIKLVKKLTPPALTTDSIHGIEIYEGEHLTKHLPEKYYDAALNGQFRFGTLQIYKPDDQKLLAGRLSDIQEGSHWLVVNSESSHHQHTRIDDSQIAGSTMMGFENQIIVETVANDYCACLSQGLFRPKRGRALRSSGNRDLNRFVSYDTKKLMAALEEMAQEHFNDTDVRVIPLQVQYQLKDSELSISGHATIDSGYKKIDTWIKISALKDPVYSHEEEIRIMIFNLKSPGQLDFSADYLSFKDKRIMECIIERGVM